LGEKEHFDDIEKKQPERKSLKEAESKKLALWSVPLRRESASPRGGLKNSKRNHSAAWGNREENAGPDSF